MRKLFLTIAMVLLCTAAFADVYVSGYTRRDGTYVQPYYRTSPNSSQYDNYSTKGNVNPYTGQEGYRTPNYQPSNPLYQPSTAGQYQPKKNTFGIY